MIDLAHPDYGNTPASPQRPVFGYALADASAPPAVSIVTPLYNTGAVFRDTIRSVLLTTWPGSPTAPPAAVCARSFTHPMMSR